MIAEGGRRLEPPRPFLPDLIPPPLWHSNARSVLGPSRWRRVSRIVCGEAGEAGCEYCGEVGRRHPLEAHEVWTYEISGAAGVQRLTGLVALCPGCHEAKHYGRAANIGRGADALARIAALNGWTSDRARAAVQAAFEEMGRRSEVPRWSTDVGLAESLLT